MDPAMARELERRGGESSGHESRPVAQGLLLGADLVLTMEFAQHMRILGSWPWAGVRVLGLRQAARTIEILDGAVTSVASVRDLVDAAPRDSMGWDIADPYGQGRRAVRRCALEIDELLESLIRGLLP